MGGCDPQDTVRDDLDQREESVVSDFESRRAEVRTIREVLPPRPDDATEARVRDLEQQLAARDAEIASLRTNDPLRYAEITNRQEEADGAAVRRLLVDRNA